MNPVYRFGLSAVGKVLYPAFAGYMSAKYLKKIHVSRFRHNIAVVYARVDATPVIISVDEASRMNEEQLGSWLFLAVAELNPNEVIPQLDKFRAAAVEAHRLVHSKSAAEATVPRIILATQPK